VGPTGAASSTGASTGGIGSSTTVYGFTDANSLIVANTDRDISIVTYGGNQISRGLSNLDSEAPGYAINVPQAGRLHDMRVSLQYVTSSAAVSTGIATLYKTNGCSTGFQPTALQVHWGVAEDNDTHVTCTANTTDMVEINPFERFLVVFSATGATGAQYAAHASVSLLYTID
jgi:hypothetical protein